MDSPAESGGLGEFDRKDEIFPTNPLRIEGGQSASGGRKIEPHGLGGDTVRGDSKPASSSFLGGGYVWGEAITFTVER